MISCFPAEPRHAAEVAELARESGLSVDLDRHLCLPYAHAWLARRGGHDSIAGFAIAHQVADEFELIDLGTRSHERRRGVATSLLERLFQVAHELGISAMHLEVRSANQAALGLYQKHGFIVGRRRPGYYQNPDDDALCLCRPFFDPSQPKLA